MVKPRTASRLLLAVPAILVLSAPSVRAELEVILDARPGAVLVGFESGKFELVGPEETGQGTVIVEEQGGNVSTVPNLRFGVGWDTTRYYVDATAVGGYLLSEYFRCVELGAGLAGHYKFRKNVSAGPHADLLYFTLPGWGGDAEVEFSDSWGAVMGLEMLIGYDIMFTFSIDYFYTYPFEVDPEEPWTSEDDEFDASGVLLQFGIRGRF